MYLTARIFGLSIYFVVLICALFALRRSDSRTMRIVLGIFLMALCAIAFFYEPAPQADLYRIRQYAANFANMSWSNIRKGIKTDSIGLASTPAAIILYKILGSTGIKGIIPLFSCLVCYGCIFTVIRYTQRQFALSGACIAMTILVLMSADYFMPTIATIRSYMAAVLVMICIYREGKHNRVGLLEIALYAIAIFLHAIGIGLVAIRIAAIIFRHGQPIIYTIGYVVIFGAGTVLLIAKFGNKLTTILDTVGGYATGDGTGAQYSYLWERIILAVMLVLQIYTLIIAKRKSLDKNKALASYYTVSRISVCALIVLSFQFTFMMRLSYFTTLVELPLIMMNNKDVSQKRGKWTVNLYSICVAVMLVLTCSRGYLCSLKFW